MPDDLKTTVADRGDPSDRCVRSPPKRNPHKLRKRLVSFIAEISGEELPPLDVSVNFQTPPRLTSERFAR